MNESEKNKYIIELHSKNQLFLNKALLVIPSVAIGFIIHLVSNSNCDGIVSLIFLILSLACFSASTCVLLWSFFEVEKIIENLENKNKELSIKFTKIVNRQNYLAFFLIVAGIVLTFFGIVMMVIEGHIMSNKTEINVALGMPRKALTPTNGIIDEICSPANPINVQPASQIISITSNRENISDTANLISQNNSVSDAQKE